MNDAAALRLQRVGTAENVKGGFCFNAVKPTGEFHVFSFKTSL
jgi:hypothetical protein